MYVRGGWEGIFVVVGGGSGGGSGGGVVVVVVVVGGGRVLGLEAGASSGGGEGGGIVGCASLAAVSVVPHDGINGGVEGEGGSA